MSGSVETDQRQDWLRRRLDATGRVRIDEAARRLKVSEMTIRRDLQELEAMGVARRLRGGAVAAGPLPFSGRHRVRARAKSRIAAKLLPLVPTGGAVGFDASSTLLRLAVLLRSARGLTVATNGPEAFDALQGRQGVTTILTGGQMEPRTGSLVGPIACRAAASLTLSRFFMSAAGVHADVGASEACLEEAEVKQALAGAAAEVVLAADSSKLGLRAVAVGLEWDRIGLLVTELDPSHPRLAQYRRLTRIV